MNLSLWPLRPVRSALGGAEHHDDVEAGLIQRSDDPADRRNLVLGLTAAGDQLVKDVTNQRRAAIASVLAKMSPQLRNDLVPVLRGSPTPPEITEKHVWDLGWSTEHPVGLHSGNQGAAGQR